MRRSLAVLGWVYLAAKASPLRKASSPVNALVAIACVCAHKARAQNLRTDLIVNVVDFELFETTYDQVRRARVGAPDQT